MMDAELRALLEYLSNSIRTPFDYVTVMTFLLVSVPPDTVASFRLMLTAAPSVPPAEAEIALRMADVLDAAMRTAREVDAAAQRRSMDQMAEAAEQYANGKG